MIIYGSRATHLKTERVNNVKCDYCNQQNQHTISVYGKYAHVFWIPLFPIGKKAVSECTHCKSTLEKKDMNEQLKRAHNEVKQNTKTPIWNWAGFGVLALLIGAGMFASNKHKKDVVNFIAQPKKGDIIEYSSSKGNYSTLKITNVANDSVYVVANSMEIAKKSKIYKIDKEKNYNAERYALSLKDYKNAFDTKRFLDVDR